MNKLKIGVLGVSNHLLKRIVLPLKKTKSCYIYGIASRNISKAKSFASEFGINQYYGSYEELLNDKNIDAVYIPLPNHLHYEWIVKAANAGKHILCEKPITLNAAQANECVSAAAKKGVLLMEAFMYQFHPQWIHARDIIRTNQIGNIVYIRTSFAYNNPNGKNIRNIKDYGGGALMDIGCYAVSISRYLIQKEPSRAICIAQQHDAFKTDYLTSAIMDFNGIHSSFTVSTLSEGNQSVEIVGTAGTIKIHVPFNTYVDTKACITVSTPQGSREVIFDVCDQYGLMFDSFATQIITEIKPSIDNNKSVNNMRVIDALFKSADSQQWESI